MKSYVESVVPYTYYHNEFPVNAAVNAAYVRITGGYRPDQWTSKRRPSFQIVIRNVGPAAETVAMALYEAFHQRRFYDIGTQHIVASFADQSAPLYLGTDENGRYMYSVNFTATLLVQ
ncbi:minor capsid protein [Paenibacillus sp. J5C_2022]|nr:minor capsid protein [Paenibacillus sp. J5C2022]